VKGRLDLGMRVSMQNARVVDALFAQIQTRTDPDTVKDTNAHTESDTAAQKQAQTQIRAQALLVRAPITSSSSSATGMSWLLRTFMMLPSAVSCTFDSPCSHSSVFCCSSICAESNKVQLVTDAR
jgi:hypothetical protein